MAERIAIALVNKVGRYLVGRRGEDVPLAGCWEFPGGKCLSGERPEEAAVRECREETGLEVVAHRVRSRVTHEYEHGSVELHFVDCRLAPGAESTEPAAAFRWVAAAELGQFRFPPANAEVVCQLVAEAEG